MNNDDSSFKTDYKDDDNTMASADRSREDEPTMAPDSRTTSEFDKSLEEKMDAFNDELTDRNKHGFEIDKPKRIIIKGLITHDNN